MLPAVVLFGLGIACVVAPLTNTLMGSIPERFSGLGSAINNAIARVGQPLLGALIFVAVSGTFYAALSTLAPELDLASASVRAGFPPSTRRASTRRPSRSKPPRALDRRLPPGHGGRRARRDRWRRVVGGPARGASPTAAGRGDPGVTTRDWDAATYDRVAHPITRWVWTSSTDYRWRATSA